ncbi:cupin domain-containing protein [Streptomyces sp. SID13031]|uniref:cupin domain-containing protein n=1 Tax=Streptomyces sp. SID13031 TaxID=2706046 RepID=UPI0013CB19F1|nr:cupin domain-containing protein [Streptomyces sp. SID13031]NEA35367.1 cupin domain-containing protein [Streptomyces sp. SID13031]
MCEFGPAAALPGGIGISRLTVYDIEAPDGLVGGTPHVHLACSEGYYVIAGSGAVQTLNPKGFTETPLQAGTVVWFDPGTIHRLINGGELQILTLMSNSGLPEAGDAVLTLPPEHLIDRETYLKATTLTGEGEARTPSAMTRRNLALEGFAVLRDAYAADGPAALDAFYESAIRIVQPQLADWRKRWEEGARRLADETGAALEALEAGKAPHLQTAELHELPAPTEHGRHGMCGRLDVYDVGERP